MKTIGIKLADGSFYPVLEDNTPSTKKLELTTAHNNQTKVMVDLYRSATCSMEDAEYVDSLQIENLVARPNGEADIKFTVSLDEDNKLSAKIVDSETGNESNTNITLVSRTLEERLITDEYGINDTDDNSGAGAAVAGAVAAGGLLAAAAALRDKDDDSTEEASDDTIIADETIDEEIEMPAEETAVEEPVVEEPAAEETVAEDVAFDDAVFEDTPVEETPVEEPVAEEAPAEETFTDEAPAEEPVEATDDFGDMDFDLPENPETTEAAGDSENSEDLGLSDMDFDFPEDSSDETTEAAEETITSEETIDSEETISSEDTIADDETVFAEDTITDSSEDTGLDDMDFDLPDDTNENPEMPDDFFNTEETMKDPTFDSDSPAAGLSFDGLYDEETERGTPAQSEVEEVKKKTKVPVIICIICAIICIIATLLILFIIPSKYNLITKKNAKNKAPVVVEQPTPEPEPIPEPEPAVPEAKEDEVIIIEKAEEVVPAQPPVAEEKPKDIVYKIKWGDTLWDIADTYYKNPWRYKYIARYNGIKNPDYIISGTKIVIPAE